MRDAAKPILFVSLPEAGLINSMLVLPLSVPGRQTAADLILALPALAEARERETAV